MPRPLSWLPRLHEIRRTVASSVRSHYDRRDLERLFELQPRAAQKLLELLPTIAVGTSRLVDRQALSKFLDGVNEAGDTGSFLKRMRLEKAGVSHKKVRSFVRRDVEPIGIGSLPESIGLSRGRLEVSFQSVEQLAEAMYALARILEAEGDVFAQAYAPLTPSEVVDDAVELDALFGELEAMEKERSIRS